MRGALAVSVKQNCRGSRVYRERGGTHLPRIVLNLLDKCLALLHIHVQPRPGQCLAEMRPLLGPQHRVVVEVEGFIPLVRRQQLSEPAVVVAAEMPRPLRPGRLWVR